MFVYAIIISLDAVSICPKSVFCYSVHICSKAEFLTRGVQI